MSDTNELGAEERKALLKQAGLNIEAPVVAPVLDESVGLVAEGTCGDLLQQVLEKQVGMIQGEDKDLDEKRKMVVNDYSLNIIDNLPF